MNKGDVVDTGTYIGKTGKTGNTTGAHLDLEYYTSKGALADVMKTIYGGFYTGKETIGETAGKALQGAGKEAQRIGTPIVKSFLSTLLPNLNPEDIDYESLNSLILNS